MTGSPAPSPATCDDLQHRTSTTTRPGTITVTPVHRLDVRRLDADLRPVAESPPVPARPVRAPSVCPTRRQNLTVSFTAQNTLTISDVTAAEGTGRRHDDIHVHGHPGALSGTSTVGYATAAGTATSGASCTGATDYVTTSGTLTFGAAVTTQTIAVTVCRDATFEGAETFNMHPLAPDQRHDQPTARAGHDPERRHRADVRDRQRQRGRGHRRAARAPSHSPSPRQARPSSARPSTSRRPRARPRPARPAPEPSTT